ncbi:MAG: hypothetical protein QN120_00615 [Armatimonadota bacterium]|nr:hypothetical protein [Armatimonadota bacterium]
MDAAVQALAARVDALERQMALAGQSVEGALRRRGWRPKAHSSLEHILLPVPPEPARLDRYYQDLRHYHFRRLLQEAVEQGVLSPPAVRSLEARWGARAVARTLNRLVDYGLLVRTQAGFAACGKIRSFGGTLEWFVAQVLIREHLAPAAWDVRLHEIRQGGDFDVLAVLDGRLGYFECKGSPPYNVSADALAQFLDRCRRLRPDFAVLVQDTTLKIDRNIIANLQALLGAGAGLPRHLVRTSEGIYEAEDGMKLFVVTGRRSLAANLARCLRRLHGAGG